MRPPRRRQEACPRERWRMPLHPPALSSASGMRRPRSAPRPAAPLPRKGPGGARRRTLAGILRSQPLSDSHAAPPSFPGSLSDHWAGTSMHGSPILGGFRTRKTKTRVKLVLVSSERTGLGPSSRRTGREGESYAAAWYTPRIDGADAIPRGGDIGAAAGDGPRWSRSPVRPASARDSPCREVSRDATKMRWSVGRCRLRCHRPAEWCVAGRLLAGRRERAAKPGSRYGGVVCSTTRRSPHATRCVTDDVVAHVVCACTI